MLRLYILSYFLSYYCTCFSIFVRHHWAPV